MEDNLNFLLKEHVLKLAQRDEKDLDQSIIPPPPWLNLPMMFVAAFNKWIWGGFLHNLTTTTCPIEKETQGSISGIFMLIMVCVVWIPKTKKNFHHLVS